MGINFNKTIKENTIKAYIIISYLAGMVFGLPGLFALGIICFLVMSNKSQKPNSGETQKNGW